ncbi:MAG: cytochrome c [Sulfurimicrobium sp.]|nr:cytochrome c [Sulfurimicrobium sp.]
MTISSLGGVKSVLADESPGLQRQKELVRLVRQDCGSCHGMTLAGGLGPALLPAALAGKPGESLVATVLYGRPGTPMPPWGAFLNEEEAKWVVEMLLKGFPNEP